MALPAEPLWVLRPAAQVALLREGGVAQLSEALLPGGPISGGPRAAPRAAAPRAVGPEGLLVVRPGGRLEEGLLARLD